MTGEPVGFGNEFPKHQFGSKLPKHCCNTAIIAHIMNRRKLILAIVSGLLLAGAMPWPGIWALAWIGLAPLLAALRGTKAREAAVLGLLTGLVYYGITLSWLTIFGCLPWIAVALKESAFLVVFAIFAAGLLEREARWWTYAAIPAVWTALQWARCLGAFGFSWSSLAHTQANNLAIAQIASVTGPWGIDYLVCLFSLAVATAVSSSSGRRRFGPLWLAGGLAVAAYTGGCIAIGSAPHYETSVRVAIIQGDLRRTVDTTLGDVRSAYETYRDMSRTAAAGGTDFIIWPETTITTNVRDTDWGLLFSDLARSTRANYIIGGYDPSPDPSVRENYNSAFFYGRDGAKLGVYHKVRLVPYGEFVALRKQMPWLADYGIREIDVLPARSHRLIDTEIGRIGVGICFESLFPGIARIETLQGAAALVFITNDSWFERTQAARQHLMMAKLRAIENRRYVVRGASTGISAIIDPYGRTTAELGVYKRGIVKGRIAPLRGLTPYVRFGDWFAYLCVAVSGVTLALVGRGTKRE